MRVLFALPGLHRFDRGAEIAFIAIADQLAKLGNTVTLIGSGPARTGTAYRFLRAKSASREAFDSFPSIPLLRNDCAYEELTFIPDFLRQYRPANYDVTLTCSYPFTNWILRRPTLRGRRPPHIFVTQNGDWPAFSNHSEYRWFGCDGLVCTNPDFYERNKNRWRCELIPNGVDERFKPGNPHRRQYGLPTDKPIVLMVSAFISSKRIDAGIAALEQIPGAHLVVAGTGPLKAEIEAAARAKVPGRFTFLSVSPDAMPALYQSADVFLHLSKEESFGNVFLEAMACGLPVVAHDSPRTRWIIGTGQFLVNTDDQKQLVKAITRAANGDPALRQKGIDQAKLFSWEKAGRMYHDFLGKVAGRP